MLTPSAQSVEPSLEPLPFGFQDVRCAIEKTSTTSTGPNYTLGFSGSSVRLVHAPPRSPLRRIKEVFAAESDLVARGLVPFGYEGTLEAGPVCLQLASGHIYFVDRSRGENIPLASSFDAFLRILTLSLDNLDADASAFAELDPGLPPRALEHWRSVL